MFRKLAWVMGVALAVQGWVSPAVAAYTVVDSEVEVVNDLNFPIAWLDNDRVIFTALKPGQPRMQINVKQRPIGRIVIWDTAKNKVSEYADGILLCYSEGVISYTVQEIDPVTGKEDWIGKSGQLGEEKEVRAYKPGDPPKHRDYHTCRVYPEKRPVLAEGRFTLELKKEHGYLELEPKPGATKKPGAVVYHRAGGEVVELPISRGNVDTIYWSDYGQGYVLKQHIYAHSIPNALPEAPPVSLLKPDGTVIRYAVPLDFFHINSAFQTAVTKVGLVLISDRFDIAHSPGQAGMYLVRGERVAKILGGNVGGDTIPMYYGSPALAVSPDGCKVAFRHGMQAAYYNPFTIKMVNLCEGAE